MAWSQSFGFGSGFMFVTPTAPATDLSPVRIGVMQNVSLEISFDEKPLHGQNQFPVAVARGKAKVTCSCEFAQIDSKAIATVFLGATPVVGEAVVADLEAHALAATTNQTVTHSGSTTFLNDLGVYYATTGQPLKQVTAGSETTGAYSVTQAGATAGKYVFSTGDSNASLLFSYEWTDGATGFKTTVTNQAMGTYIPFQSDLFQTNPEATNTQWGVRLYKCMSSKLALATKQDDWIIPKMDFSIYANPAGNVMDFNTPN